MALEVAKLLKFMVSVNADTRLVEKRLVICWRVGGNAFLGLEAK
jgi:hypothetical protein